MECFVPGCSNTLNYNRPSKSFNTISSYLTFHRLPNDAQLLVQLLTALSVPHTTKTTPDNIICSSHFPLIIGNHKLVKSLLDQGLQDKPNPMAISSAPRCAASVAGCNMNLYSDVALFKFPEPSRSFDLWRMVAGSPPIQDCQYLCARHFKRSSFVNLNMEELVPDSIPVYPTRPLHPVHMNYRPLKKPLVQSETSRCDIVDLHQEDEVTCSKTKKEVKKKWRCAAVGCDVSSDSHPNMRKINMPPYSDRLTLWREIVGDIGSTKYNNSLCTRHFGINQFYDGETRRHFVKMTNPVYPTGQLNLHTMDYCPEELDITVAMENDGNEQLVVVTLDDVGKSEGEEVEEVTLPSDADSEDKSVAKCSSVGCPVSSLTHPNVKIHDFPYKTPKRIKSWLRIAGENCIKPLRLCARHFDSNNREMIPKYPFWDLDPHTQTYKPTFDPTTPKCCVPRCTSTDDTDVSYHRFPLDKQAFKLWTRRIGWEQLELYDKGDVFRGFRICSKHFSRSWFTINDKGEEVLSSDALPSLFPSSDDSSETLMSGGLDVEDSRYGDNSASSVITNDRISPAKKRKCVLVETRSPGKKKCKIDRELSDSEVVKLTKSPHVGSRSSSAEYSFWIASDGDGSRSSSSEFETKESELLEFIDDAGSPELDGDCKKTSLLGDENESSSGRKKNQSFCSDVVSDHIPGASCDTPQSPDDSEIIEKSETCELWTESLSSKHLKNSNKVEGDLLDSATRLCNFSAVQIEKLRTLTDKDTSLNELKELVVEHLENVITITGVDFLRKCLECILNDGSKKRRTKDDEPSAEEKQFAVALQSISGKAYRRFSQTANLPSSSTVRTWATNGDGYPGFNEQGFSELRSKSKGLGGASLNISLCVTEVTIDRCVGRAGNNLFGYVDLGYGRFKDDFVLEASSALVFYVNGITHDFTIALGYCLIRDVSPKIRANLIEQYLLKIHSVGVKCVAVVCDGSAMTYRVYRELKVLGEETSPHSGFFKHPANKIDNVYCFVDIFDAMDTLKHHLTECKFFLSQYKKKVRWSDVERTDDFLRLDLKQNEFSSSDVDYKELEKLQVLLKNDHRPFKRATAKALKSLYGKYFETPVKAEGTIEFLEKMDSIMHLFSRHHAFSKELPAIRRINLTITLGCIKNLIIYLESLTDLKGLKLSEGHRRVPVAYLLLNLISLEGYLKRAFIYEKKARPRIIMTRSLTLSTARAMNELLVPKNSLITASQFRNAYIKQFCHNRSNFGAGFSNFQKSPSLSPLRIGVHVAESYKYQRLSSDCERVHEFLTDNVFHNWLESPGCPECKEIVLDELQRFELGRTSLVSDVNKMLRIGERHLFYLCDEISLNRIGQRFHRFTNSVLNEMTFFSGFKLHEHLFGSVAYGNTPHFIMLVADLLGTYVRYRIGFMTLQDKIYVKSGIRTSFNQKSWA